MSALGALAGHDAADERGQGGQVSDEPGLLARLGTLVSRPARIARYWRRLSLIVCSFWIGCFLQREYTMRQPLNYPFQKDLAKVSGREELDIVGTVSYETI